MEAEKELSRKYGVGEHNKCHTACSCFKKGKKKKGNLNKINMKWKVSVSIVFWQNIKKE